MGILGIALWLAMAVCVICCFAQWDKWREASAKYRLDIRELQARLARKDVEIKSLEAKLGQLVQGTYNEAELQRRYDLLNDDFNALATDQKGTQNTIKQVIRELQTLFSDDSLEGDDVCELEIPEETAA